MNISNGSNLKIIGGTHHDSFIFNANSLAIYKEDHSPSKGRYR